MVPPEWFRILAAKRGKRTSCQFQYAKKIGYPPKINGINIRMYHYTNGWVRSGTTTAGHVLSIKQAVSRVLRDYSSYCSHFDLKLVLAEDLKAPVYRTGKAPIMMLISSISDVGWCCRK
jgi:hypothetical protein